MTPLSSIKKARKAQHDLNSVYELMAITLNEDAPLFYEEYEAAINRGLKALASLDRVMAKLEVHGFSRLGR